MQPVRLAKKLTPEEKVEAWTKAHAHILLPILIVMLILLCLGLCFALVGVSAVESGTMRNFLARGV